RFLASPADLDEPVGVDDEVHPRSRRLGGVRLHWPERRRCGRHLRPRQLDHAAGFSEGGAVSVAGASGPASARALIGMPVRSSIRAILSAVGRAAPVSQAWTACLVTPNFSANSACVYLGERASLSFWAPTETLIPSK